MIIKKQSYPRAALIGNPSDGYYGKTIAFVFKNFHAEVVLYETPELEILPAERDHSVFLNINHLVQDVKHYGYYGGIRLLKAALKKFYEYCQEHNLYLNNKNFTIRYKSDIPHQLGLAGSSAIITACMRTLEEFYNIHIPPHLLATLVLSVETEELGISAGLQDRVAQAFEHPVFMDFNKEFLEQKGYGIYSLLPSDSIPERLYIAYKTKLSECSGKIHNTLRERYNNKDPNVLNAVNEWSELTEQAKAAIEKHDWDTLSRLMNRNFDIRHSVCEIDEENVEMINIARSFKASAKFTGSGGAIIGIYPNERVYEQMKKEFYKHDINIIKPDIVLQQYLANPA